MYVKPSLIFMLVWIPPLLVMEFYSGGVISYLDSSFLIFITIITIFFILFDVSFGVMFPRAVGPDLFARLSIGKVDKFLTRLLVLWLLIYVINIVGSRGVPIWWVLSGSGKTYADFGLPTLSGLANLMRAFALTIFAYLYLMGHRRRRAKGWIFALLFSAFVLETGRGNGLVLALHGFGVWAMLCPVRLRYLPILLLLFVLFLLGLGGVQVIRHSEGLATMFSYLEGQGIETQGSVVLALLAPSFLYWVGPIVNTQLNFLGADPFSLNPYFSLQGIVPTVIREYLFQPQDYGLLFNEANNTTSFLTPLMRDFGVYGAGVLVLILFVLTSFVYHRARAGYFFSFLFWPPIFMSLVLSNFSLFYTSLVVVLFPLIIFIFERYAREKYV